MKGTVLLLFLTVLSLALFPRQVLAAKKRVRTVSHIVNNKRTGTGISYSTARLSRATNSVVITFSNLENVTNNTYTLSYTANGIEQGVMGTVAPHGSSTDTRDLYFGTCSKGVCTPHRFIQNATLSVKTVLTNGAQYVKRYRLKV